MSDITLIGHASKQRVSVSHLNLYSDNTPMVKLPDFDYEDEFTMVLRPSTLTAFVTAMFLVDAVNHNGGWVKNLVLPYVPGARQDRSNITGDVLYTASSVARMINERHFSSVNILDPHSDVTPSLIRNVHVYPLSDVAWRAWHGYAGIIAPDKGAKDRAEIFAAALGLPIFYASKNRDVSTGRLSGFSVHIPTGGHFLVVDDICDGGGTFVGLGEKIKEQGAFADLYVTHGIFAKGTDELRKFYKNIYTTDSMDSTAGVLTIPVVERMIKNYV